MIQVMITCDLPTIKNLNICALTLAMDDSTLDRMVFRHMSNKAYN